MKDREKRKLRERCKGISKEEIDNNTIKYLRDRYSPGSSYSTFRKYLKVFGGSEDGEEGGS